MAIRLPESSESEDDAPTRTEIVTEEAEIIAVDVINEEATLATASTRPRGVRTIIPSARLRDPENSEVNSAAQPANATDEATGNPPSNGKPAKKKQKKSKKTTKGAHAHC